MPIQDRTLSRSRVDCRLWGNKRSAFIIITVSCTRDLFRKIIPLKLASLFDRLALLFCRQLVRSHVRWPLLDIRLLVTALVRLVGGLDAAKNRYVNRDFGSERFRKNSRLASSLLVIFPVMFSV